MERSKSEKEIDIFSEPTNGNSFNKNNSFTVNTNDMPLGSRSIGSSIVVNNQTNNKVDNIKTWGVSAYKCTKQIIQEKLGKASKTVDVDLEIRIEKLRDLQRKYRTTQDIASRLLANFTSIIENQRLIAEQFSELGQQQPELIDEFDKNATLQRHLAKQGEHFIYALNSFSEALDTLISKTISDTIITIKKYEMARVEYDAYRHELNKTKKLSVATDPTHVTKMMELKDNLSEREKLYNTLRADVDVKIKFLQENKTRVMHRQLVLFNQATLAYFSGQWDAVESNMDQLRLSMRNSNNQPPSWLEQNSRNSNDNSNTYTNQSTLPAS